MNKLRQQKRPRNLNGHPNDGWSRTFSFSYMASGLRGKFRQRNKLGKPRKSVFFSNERGRKGMKEWHQVTFTKEWMNALDDTRILAPTHFQNLVSFPRYGRLKKKCWYKLICNGTYWLLLTGHFGLVFIRPSQWSITAVRGRWTFPFDPVPGLQYTCLI